MISIGRKTVCILGLTIYKTVCGRIAIQEKKSLRKLKTGRGGWDKLTETLTELLPDRWKKANG